MGIGTSPGAMLLGAGLAERHGGAIPLISVLISLMLMFTLLWFQGALGLNPPHGDGRNFTEVTPLYFGVRMQRVTAGLIALGMIGWYGFNVGLGGAALSALLHIPFWVGPLTIGIPVLILSLGGMRSWNWLATITTLAVVILVILVLTRLADLSLPIRIGFSGPVDIIIDTATFIGYISVFSVRAPDFTARLASRKDLVFSDLLLCIPVMLIALAGVGLQRGTGSSDLVSILAGPDGLAIGNLLVTMAVIAPTFTTLYSGAPALTASIRLGSRTGMYLITITGLILAIARFDKWLLSWLIVLAAMLPPLIIPLAVESTRRRMGYIAKRLPVWVWLPGALVSLFLSFVKDPLAPLIGLITSGLVTVGWYLLFYPKMPEIRFSAGKPAANEKT